nr:MAG TPA: hypothetical protein [Caudoviricetes sp.]
MTRGFNPSRVSNNATVASFQYSYSHIFHCSSCNVSSYFSSLIAGLSEVATPT